MENRKLVTSNQITKDIIGNFLLWELIIQFCYTIIYSLIIKNINSSIVIVCISIFLQIIVAIIVWKITLTKSFKTKIILNKNIPAIMKNLVIFTIVVALVVAIYNFSGINSIIEDIPSIYENLKKEVYGYVTIFNIAYLLIYLITLIFVKKQLLNYVAVGEENK